MIAFKSSGGASSEHSRGLLGAYGKQRGRIQRSLLFCLLTWLGRTVIVM